jgi:hypothetical protein
VVGQAHEEDRIGFRQRDDDRTLVRRRDAGKFLAGAGAISACSPDLAQHLVGALALGVRHGGDFPGSLDVSRCDLAAVGEDGLRVDLEGPDLVVGGRFPAGEDVRLDLAFAVEIHRRGPPDRIPAERRPPPRSGDQSWLKAGLATFSTWPSSAITMRAFRPNTVRPTPAARPSFRASRRDICGLRRSIPLHSDQSSVPPNDAVIRDALLHSVPESLRHHDEAGHSRDNVNMSTKFNHIHFTAFHQKIFIFFNAIKIEIFNRGLSY